MAPARSSRAAPALSAAFGHLMARLVCAATASTFRHWVLPSRRDASPPARRLCTVQHAATDHARAPAFPAARSPAPTRALAEHRSSLRRRKSHPQSDRGTAPPHESTCDSGLGRRVAASSSRDRAAHDGAIAASLFNVDRMVESDEGGVHQGCSVKARNGRCRARRAASSATAATPLQRTCVIRVVTPSRIPSVSSAPIQLSPDSFASGAIREEGTAAWSYATTSCNLRGGRDRLFDSPYKCCGHRSSPPKGPSHELTQLPARQDPYSGPQAPKTNAKLLTDVVDATSAPLGGLGEAPTAHYQRHVQAEHPPILISWNHHGRWWPLST